MRLIDNDGVVAAQQRVRRQFGEQEAIGHEHQARRIRHLIREAHSEADAAAGLLSQLIGHPRSQRARGEPPWLRMRDDTGHSTAQFKTVLRQLCAFAGSGLAGDDEHLALVEGAQDFLTARGDRQFRVVLEGQRRRRARRKALPRTLLCSRATRHA